MINGILWKLRTGAPWRDLPERYGPWKTAHERLRKWTIDGTWDKILAGSGRSSKTTPSGRGVDHLDRLHASSGPTSTLPGPGKRGVRVLADR